MCGIAGCFGVHKAAELVAALGHGQQHRAVDYAGITTADGRQLYHYAGPGMVLDVFTTAVLNALHGRSAILHTRYPTTEDDPALDNTQPIVVSFQGNKIAIAHNGNLINVDELRAQLPSVAFRSSTDTEVLLHLILAQEGDIITRVKKACALARGSYSLLILLPDRLIAVRDPSGNRPLVLGQRNGGYFLASESCTFAPAEIHYMREVEPGEILTISENGLSSDYLDHQTPPARCVFEHLYYALPTSRIFGEWVSQTRRAYGRMLEEHHPAPTAHFVVGVPDSSHFIAEGYAESSRSGQLKRGILRSHYVGRSFIEADQALRNAAVVRKFSFAEGEIRGANIALIDDSIVRLTTLPKIVQALRFVGVREIHVRIAAPLITHPCYYGIDTPDRAELSANHLSVDQMRLRAGVDSLEFLTVDELRAATPDAALHCYACMTGEYPLGVPARTP